MLLDGWIHPSPQACPLGDFSENREERLEQIISAAARCSDYELLTVNAVVEGQSDMLACFLAQLMLVRPNLAAQPDSLLSMHLQLLQQVCSDGLTSLTYPHPSKTMKSVCNWRDAGRSFDWPLKQCKMPQSPSLGSKNVSMHSWVRPFLIEQGVSQRQCWMPKSWGNFFSTHLWIQNVWRIWIKSWIWMQLLLVRWKRSYVDISDFSVRFSALQYLQIVGYNWCGPKGIAETLSRVQTSLQGICPFSLRNTFQQSLGG